MTADFKEFLRSSSEAGGLQTDDVLAAFLPLAHRVAEWHERGFVAPALRSEELGAEGNVIVLRDAKGGTPTARAGAVEALQRGPVRGLEVVSRARLTSDAEHGATYEAGEVLEAGGQLRNPAYLIGYGAWEQTLGHHDALSDILSLGLVLAALALDLDFDERANVEAFLAHRNNLPALNARAHPVVVAVIREMTELDRRRRAPDLRSVIQRLETWRDQPVDIEVSELPGFAQSAAPGRRALVKTHLRDRLFEVSRRNRLLYFRPTAASVNLTVASVPLVIHLNSIRRDQLFTWQGEVAAQLSAGSAMSLGRHLRFEDQPYLAGALDKLIADARRDRAEFGFAQLRLVIAFLQWHNLKEAPNERIVSPLLLLPVDLTRRKGVRDRYVLTATSTEAEINPALRHYLKQLYGLALPETFDLTAPVTELHARLQKEIRATEPAVELRLAAEPQIELIHEKARQRLAQFKRRQLRQPRAAATTLDHSYAADDFRPLGLLLFRDKVKPSALPQRVAAGGTVDPRAPHMSPVANETARETFALREHREGNRYLWDFDICSLTLANFNYRKMSLVRDYGTLIDEETSSGVFDRVFSVEPRAVDDERPVPVRLEDSWPIVSTDATQREAVALAHSGRSYIVQGPPGTGKSQTITNLIADFVARDKRVLFVCEKRAALDVVFHRLRQRGIDELCSLIHDSQSDKKAFIQNLKQTYEGWLAQADAAERAEAERTQLAKRVKQDLEPLLRFDSVMTSAPDYIGTSVRELVHTLAELRDDEPDLDARSMERLPTFDVWRRHADIAHRLSATLEEVCGVDALASHPFRYLSTQLIRAERPLETLHQLTDRIESIVDTIERRLDESDLPAQHRDTLGDVERIVAFAQKAAPLAERNQLALLDEGSALANELAQAARALEAAQAALEGARKKTAHWRDKLEPADVDAALALAASTERSIFRFVSGSWRGLKKTLEARYEFAAHVVRPALSQVLKDLQAEYAAQEVVARERAQGGAKFVVPPDVLTAETRALREQAKSSATLAALHARLQQPQANALVGHLAALAPAVRELLESLPRLVAASPDMTLQGLGELVRDLREEADVLPDLLPLLTELAGAHEDFVGALRSFALPPRALGAGSARKSLEILHRIERWLPRFDGRLVEHLAARIASLDRQWLEANATVIRSRARSRFREHAQLSTTSVTQLDNDQRALKKRYSTGRRELEHEFGKSMRYKSIRDLAAGDSGAVIRDLKPIWLMSPLSVSDTLPLDTNLFDVVIFDEASQIPVEEAVPALYRAPQIIVVGDEMQLPPTNFFTPTRAEDNAEIEVEDDGERVAIALDADSLLTQSARNLSSTMLAWHYRSRSESLIGFSNAAFYSGNLYTIPDRELPAPEQAALQVRVPSDAATHARALLDRPLSFHLMESSPYDNRRNVGEAAYVAELVRELLQAGTKLSIGVVAFSEAQQTEIESALTGLADDDPKFSTLLEEAYVREEDDQFCGLFVKNLENVQGDERDIVILSICYGPDAQGRMLMNFGPINQRGGEKRLNVIFSRARHHMAVVSSIRHSAITNDYNDGAAALKRFLQYTECASAGDGRAARAVLEGLNPLSRKNAQIARSADTIAIEIGAALRERGYVVDEDVGQSRFRCDLAIRNRDDRGYRLGVLIDTEEHYENRDVAERYVARPEVLRAFGWTVVLVLTGDWYREPDGVLERIERRLRGESDTAEDLPLDSLPRPPPEPAQPPPPTRQDEAPPTPSRPAGGNARRCEFVEGRSSKFWEIERNDTVLTIRYGRIGTHGQALTKSFDDPKRAQHELEKLLGEKLRKGYREVPPG